MLSGNLALRSVRTALPTANKGLGYSRYLAIKRAIFARELWWEGNQTVRPERDFDSDQPMAK